MQSNYWWKITKKEQIQLVISGLIGAIICLLSITIGNFILIEIRFNILFSAYFGLTFILTGVYILLKTKILMNNTINTQWTLKQKYLVCFASVIIASGLICFCLYFDQEWHKGLNFYTKIPLYVILGMSLSSTICYLTIDLINFFVGLTQKVQQRTIVETPNQIISFIFISSLIGFLQGLLFSSLDIEDVENKNISFYLIMFEELLLVPFIIVLGCIGGVFNEYLRLKGSHLQSYTFEPINDPFTDEI
ncbi:unnamed protein product [Paramecium pentaurelia]|uniref:Transmembrane protein n=1 Tax=Paramecium pentaurelia TaxID=43138 RepID=A0A8S1YFM9_9CILI|nr:unnamed protein product [Paramecium pentaurelia]